MSGFMASSDGLNLREKILAGRKRLRGKQPPLLPVRPRELPAIADGSEGLDTIWLLRRRQSHCRLLSSSPPAGQPRWVVAPVDQLQTSG